MAHPFVERLIAACCQVYRYYQPISVRDRFKVEEQLGRREFTGPLCRDSAGNVLPEGRHTTVGLPALADVALATPSRTPPRSLTGTPGSASTARSEEVTAKVADPHQTDAGFGEESADDEESGAMDEDGEEECGGVDADGEEEANELDHDDAAAFDAAFQAEGQQAEPCGTAGKGDAPVADMVASVAEATTRAVSLAAPAAAAPVAADDATGAASAPPVVAGSGTAAPAGAPPPYHLRSKCMF